MSQLNSLELPVMEISKPVTVLLPVLVTVTNTGEEESPRLTFPKSMIRGETVNSALATDEANTAIIKNFMCLTELPPSFYIVMF